MDAKKLGKKIKLARVENDLTQAQLADAIEAKQKSISRYETGLTIPTLIVLEKIARKLNKPFSYFLDEVSQQIAISPWIEKKKLGKKIKLARFENDLTQAQLADAICAKQKSISNYENGIALPTLETLEKIVKQLNKSFAHFLDELQ